jgi:hypothetical protein
MVHECGAGCGWHQQPAAVPLPSAGELLQVSDFRDALFEVLIKVGQPPQDAYRIAREESTARFAHPAASGDASEAV